MFHKTRNKKNCLSINCKQSVKVEEEIIEFENYFKQIPVPFKIYADFECNLEGSYTKNIKITFLVVLLTKLFVLMIGLLSQLLFRGENAAYEFIIAILKEYKVQQKSNQQTI